MKILETNIGILTWLGVYSAEENESLWKKRAYKAFSLMVFVINVFGLTSSTLFFIQIATVDLETALLGLVQLVGCANALYITVITQLLRHKITSSIEKLTEIYRTRKIRLGNY